MDANTRKTVPDWVWAVLAVLVTALAIALFLTDERRDPTPALLYDTAAHEPVVEDHIVYAETTRIALELDAPSALAVDARDILYVAGDGGVLLFDSAGAPLARHATTGHATCMAVGAEGRIYLGMADRVVVLSPDGAELASWPAPAEQTWFTSIVVDETNVFVADAGERVVRRYDVEGNLLNTIDGRVNTDRSHGFIVPSRYFDVALDTGGALWIANPGKLGIEKYRHDGAALSQWHRPGLTVDAFPGCCNPIHMAFKSDGALVTAEKGIHRIKVFAADRSFDGVVAGPQTLDAGWDPALFAEPVPLRDLAVDSRDRVLALHGPLRAVLIYERSAPTRAQRESE